MKSKKQLCLTCLVALATLAGALTLSFASAPTANAAPTPPTQVCGPLNLGNLTTTGTGVSTPQCPAGFYNLWQCSINSQGNYFWAYQGRHCGPIVGF